MSKILKNNTASPIDINDVGQTVPASSQITIAPTDYLLYAASDDVITLIGNSTLTVNDGSNDLSISDGSKLIQGIFPNPVGISGPTGTQIGNDEDRLKTSTLIKSDNSSGSFDSFGRLRTSVPHVVFEADFVENDRNFLFSESTTGTASITRNSTKKHIELTVGTANGDKAVRQTKQYMRYIPGVSSIIDFVNIFESKTNNRQRVGYFDSNDGLFFQLNSGTFGVGIRSSLSGSPVDTIITQPNFSIDKLDGTGPSGLTLDLTKVQILVLDFQWLGAGTIRFGVYIHGNLIYFHSENHANLISESKFMRSGSLPIRNEIENIGTTASSTTLIQSCMTVLSEGELNAVVVQRSVSNSSTVTIGATTKVPLLSVRLKSTSDIATIIPKNFSCLVESPDEILVELVLNSTLSGGTWVSVDSTSVAEVNRTGTSSTGGIVLDSILVSQDASQISNLSDLILKIGKDLSNVSDVVTIRAISYSGNANIFASFTFREVY